MPNNSQHRTARRIFFVYDVGPQSRLEWVFSAFAGQHVEIHWIPMRYNEKNRIYRWRKLLHFCCHLEVAFRAIRQSKPGDVVVSWNFIIGAFLGAACRLLRKERVVLSLNMIAHNKQGAVAFLREKVYNYAFAFPTFLFTVNSEEILQHYLSTYKIDRARAFILPDPYLPTYTERPFHTAEGYVFCGGEAQRDWKTFFEAAARLPHRRFVGVARRKYLPKDVSIPPNVTMHYDIDVAEFDRLLANAAVVALPLLTEMPAGLIVMYKSIFFSKPLIITRTSAIENYLDDGRSAVLLSIGDSERLAAAVEELLGSEAHARQMTALARDAIRRFSPEAYSQAVYSILF
jgi:glycosyltransferase involved in cell wall biosynthesis